MLCWFDMKNLLLVPMVMQASESSLVEEAVTAHMALKLVLSLPPGRPTAAE